MTSRVRIGAGLLLCLGLMGAAGPSERAPAPPRPASQQEVDVVGVVVDPRTQQPTVLLQGRRDRRSLAMVIGLAEATGIAVPLQGVQPPRPLTHDLFLTLFGRFKLTVRRVVIDDLRDDIYYATLHLTADGTEFTVDARPSDAIALAVRVKAPVLVEDRVFDKSGSATAPRRPSI